MSRKRGRAASEPIVVATPTTLGEARRLWLEAPSLEALAAVEGCYKKAMSTMKAQRGDGPLSDAEVDIRNRLIMLLMQSGRWSLCIPGLKQLGCKVRLASCVLDYDATVTAPGLSNRPDPPGIAAEGAVPPPAFAALQRALGPLDAAYWTHHNYSVEPPSPYFSFVIPTSASLLTGADESLGVIGVLIQTVYQLGQKRFGDEKMAKVHFAELWAHNRPHASGHQLHYDSDDEGRGGIRNPIVTSVLFLQGEVGGPTLLTTQRLKDNHLCEYGWLCHPKEGRLLVFDGTVLHGVIPGKGVSPSVGQRRVTVMVALWEHIQTRPGDGPGSARPFPQEKPLPQWAKDITLRVSTTPISTEACVVPQFLPRVWENIDGQPIDPSAPICAYDEVYQGF
jgi:hypothetical protein